MPYQLSRYNHAPLTTVDDGATDNSTSLTFVGKNFAGYGGIQNENFLYLLENFANGSPPSNPISGQIWYDSINHCLKFYDPTISDNYKWRTTGGSYVSATAPTTSLNTGDFWFDTTAKQLKAWNGTSFTLVGPQAVSGAGQTNLESISVRDTLGNSHAIVRAVTDGTTVFIISKDEFNLATTESLYTNGLGNGSEYNYINQGVTLINSSDGHTSTDYRFWGTASNSDKLGNIAASNYITKSSASFTSGASFPDAGITVGNSNDIKIFVDNGLGTIENTVSSTLAFKIKNSGTLIEPLLISGTTVIPGDTNIFDLGTALKRWNNIYTKTITADSFVGPIDGTSSSADSLKYGTGNYVSATDASTPNTIVARDSNSNFSANIITAVATQARYADLAEKYETDVVYEPGTVVVFGGIKEITVTDIEEDTRVAGVVSTEPAYLMNIGSTGIAVALRGKVPCKVVGSVNKGDILVSSTVAGYAKRGNILSPAASIVGKSLEDKFDLDTGTIMMVVT
jgi:hypothetical protein